MMEGFARTEIDTSGARIVTAQSGKGPPLLLLHGNPFTHLSWHKFAPRLAQEFTVVATDLRGYGDFLEAAGRQGPRELFVPRHGAGPDRGDGLSRLQAVHGRQATTAVRVSVHRMCRSTAPTWCSAPRSSRHHSAAQSLHPHDPGMGQVVHHWLFNSPQRSRCPRR